MSQLCLLEATPLEEEEDTDLNNPDAEQRFDAEESKAYKVQNLQTSIELLWFFAPGPKVVCGCQQAKLPVNARVSETQRQRLCHRHLFPLRPS